MRRPLKELQRSVGDDNTGGCSGVGGGVGDGDGLSGGYLGSQDFSCGGGVCCRKVISGLTAAGLQHLRRLCWRRPLKELQRSVGDDDAGGCGGVGGVVGDGNGLSGGGGGVGGSVCVGGVGGAVRTVPVCVFCCCCCRIFCLVEIQRRRQKIRFSDA